MPTLASSWSGKRHVACNDKHSVIEKRESSSEQHGHVDACVRDARVKPVIREIAGVAVVQKEVPGGHGEAWSSSIAVQRCAVKVGVEKNEGRGGE